MSSSQSIKVLRPLKGGIVHEDFGVSSNNATQSENRLIHEHDFITARIKEINSFLIHCITCGIYYKAKSNIRRYIDECCIKHVDY